MGLIQSSRQSTGGGGGGLSIAGFAVDQFTQATNFISGGVVLSLTHTPILSASILVDYNGQRLLAGSSYSYSSGAVTILFDDPTVTDYETPPVFQISYAF